MSKYTIQKYFDECLIAIENKLKTDGLTNNIQLDKLGKSLFNERYKGAKMSNQIPKLKDGEMCIINTDPSTKKVCIGLHFLLIKTANSFLTVSQEAIKNYHQTLNIKDGLMFVKFLMKAITQRIVENYRCHF